MKRFLVPVMTLLLVGGLIAGCVGGVKTYVDEEGVINTSVNQEFIIALDANPTTGYNWEESHDEARLRLVGEEYKPEEKAPGLVGAGGTQYFRFRAFKSGTAEITVTYKRSWEADHIEQKVFSINIK